MIKNKTNFLNKGISGSTLKVIAMILMLIDHFAAIVILKLIYLTQSDQAFNLLKNIYYICRFIGRISFPIFIFLLIEGFTHTKNKNKYAMRLFIFALISEVPFNLAIYDSYFYFNHQNIFFTLFLGLLSLIFLEQINNKFKKVTNLILFILISLFFMSIAKILNTDYDAFGILAIILMYLFRSSKLKATFASCFSLMLITTSQIFSFLSLIPMGLYNGKRGLNLKYIFYIFYPAHLLILYSFKVWIS